MAKDRTKIRSDTARILNSEANISILRTVKIKYVFLFPSQNKGLFLLEILLLPLNPFNCQREEQNCLAERQLSLVLCWYFTFCLNAASNLV